MARSNKLLSWQYRKNKFHPTSETLEILEDWRNNHNEGDYLNSEMLTAQAARKLGQHKRYHAYYLPIVAEYVSGMEKYVEHVPNKFGALVFSYKILHRILTLKFSIECNHPELVDYYPVRKNGKIEIEPIVSESFGKMSQKMADEFIGYVDKLIFNATGKSVDEIQMER